MSLCHVWPRTHAGLSSASGSPFTARAAPVSVISPLCFFKETRVIQSAGADKTSAGSYEWSGGPESGAARPGRASVWADSVSAWHRAGRRVPAVPGKGVKSSWQSFLYLAKLPLAKNTSHFSRFRAAENAMHPSRSPSQQVYFAPAFIFPWNINFLFALRPLSTSSMLLCGWACPPSQIIEFYSNFPIKT